jgi:phosphoribosylformylglycinamidine synthase
LEAEAKLHELLSLLSFKSLISSACDIADGGIAVALAQASFPKGIGATIEQDPGLMGHPLFGLFAEPASTMLICAPAGKLAEIESLAADFNFSTARIGTTGGDTLQISVYSDPVIAAPLADLRQPWTAALETALYEEVTA